MKQKFCLLWIILHSFCNSILTTPTCLKIIANSLQKCNFSDKNLTLTIIFIFKKLQLTKQWLVYIVFDSFLQPNFLSQLAWKILFTSAANISKNHLENSTSIIFPGLSENFDFNFFWPVPI